MFTRATGSFERPDRPAAQAHAPPTTGPAGVDELLWLQRHVGNQAVTALVGRPDATGSRTTPSPSALQRTPDPIGNHPKPFGLAISAETTKFAMFAVSFLRNKSGASPAEFVDFLFELANDGLREAKVPPLTRYVLAPISGAVTGAQFQPWD